MSLKREIEIVNEVLQILGQRPELCRVWRQNTGCLHSRRSSIPSSKHRIDKLGRPVRFGVNGAGDISGLLVDGRRLEIEVKTETGKQSDEQKNFEAMIRRFGGVYLLVRSAEEALRMVTKEMRNEQVHKIHPKSVCLVHRSRTHLPGGDGGRYCVQKAR